MTITLYNREDEKIYEAAIPFDSVKRAPEIVMYNGNPYVWNGGSYSVGGKGIDHSSYKRATCLTINETTPVTSLEEL